MKMKLKLDGDTIKQGFLNHFEKILFGCVVLFFLWFVYLALGRDRLTFTPDDMRSQASRAEANVRDAKANPPKPNEYLPAVLPSTTQVREQRYEFAGVLNPPIVEVAGKREMPEALPVERLKGSAGNGGFAMADANAAEAFGGSDMRGQRWVVLVGLAPWQKQIDAYKAKFEGTLPQEMALQLPDYAYFRVQRAQVDSLDESAEPKWETLRVIDAIRTMELWRGMGGSVDIDPRHQIVSQTTSVNLTFPLGPLQGRTWGNEVAYPPEIPLAFFTPEGAEAGAAGKDAKKDDGKDKPPTKKTPPRPARPDDPDDPDAIAGMGGMGSGGMMGMPGMGSGGSSGGMTKMMPGMGSGGSAGGMTKMMPGMGSGGSAGAMAKMMSGMGSGGSAGGMGKMMPGMGSGGSAGSMAKMMSGMGSGGMGMPGMGYGDMTVEEPQYKLFRYFDFTVEPGKRYRYRVQLQLANPNLGLPPKYVAKEEFAKLKYIDAPWSDATPVITVPYDAQVLVKGVKSNDGSANLLVVNVDPKDGSSSSEDVQNVQRGQLLNLRDRKFSGSRAGGMGMGMMGMGSMPGMMAPGMAGAAGGESDEPEKKVNYLTEMVYVDHAGGQRLIGRQDTEPVQLLFINSADGRLVIRNEIDDRPEITVYQPPEAAESSTAGGAMPGMGSSPMGMGSSPMGMPGMMGGSAKGAKGGKSSSSGYSSDMMKMMDDSGGKKKKR